MVLRANRVLVILLFLILAAGCSSSGGDEEAGSSSTPANTVNVSLNKDDYPVFPDPDAGADPSVPAEQGGKGFKGEGWETNTEFDLIGDPRAVKGGTMRDFILSFPGTLRMAGPEWNTVVNYMISNLVYEQLLTLHPTSLQYIPVIATHWKIDPDKKTFRFRIDPNARFSDGAPVTAEDVVASWKFHTDKGIQDLYFNGQYNKLEMPVAESKYIVRMKAKELAWRNFEVAATMRVFPANVLKQFDGKKYLEDYNFKLMPGTGPYTVSESDIDKGKSITLRRRKDYWAANRRANVGQFNFDEYRYVVVRDDNLAFEMFKKGELDYFYINRPKVWADELNYDAVQRGLIAKRAIYNNTPADLAYIAFNTRRKPWDDVRIRKALALLFNREQLIEKLFYNQYTPTNSFYPASIYENPNNPKNLYNPQEALKLLAEAGWKDHNAQGQLTKNGQPLQAELLYSAKVYEPWLTVYQEDLRKAGITLNLRFINPETRFKMLMQRQFEVSPGAWGAGSVFPEPRPEYHSEMANVENTNNISGFNDKRIDELCEKYEVTFDPNDRVNILKELDGVLAAQYQYILRWYDAAQRIAYWNKFGMPEGSFSRVGDYSGSLAPGIAQLWWIDPAKSDKLRQALGSNSAKLEVPEVEDHYWQGKYGQAQKEMEAQSKLK